MHIHWSWFNRIYTNTEVQEYVPNEPGVYLLWLYIDHDNWQCFYAGSTPNLQTALLGHLSDEEPNHCIKKAINDNVCGFEYAAVTHRSKRDGICKYLYDHYQPLCNEADPGGKPIAVNLPAMGPWYINQNR